jgi:hypothetical protein
LATPGRLVLDSPRAGELFPRYLAIGYHLTCAMVPLMKAALGRARELGAKDPTAAGLTGYLERHISEEMHGDEPGGDLLHDLEALGADSAALRAAIPPPKIARLIGAQYFWIFHHHPVAVLGFLQLEVLHPHRPTLERLIEKTGLPRDGFRQLLLHAELEVAHARELHRVLDSLPLEREHEELIGLSALHTVALLTDALLDAVQTELDTDREAGRPEAEALTRASRAFARQSAGAAAGHCDETLSPGRSHRAS